MIHLISARERESERGSGCEVGKDHMLDSNVEDLTKGCLEARADIKGLVIGRIQNGV